MSAISAGRLRMLLGNSSCRYIDVYPFTADDKGFCNVDEDAPAVRIDGNLVVEQLLKTL